MISEEKRIGDYIFVTISDEGLSHRLDKIPNQDAVMCEVVDEDFAIAVSDGVGSCQKADVGSKSAVESVRRIFSRLKTGKMEINQAVVAEAIIATWKEFIDNDHINDYCATLKAAIKIGNELLLISVGDGMLAVTSNGISKMAPMDEGSFVNQTFCLNKNVNYSDLWISSFMLDTYVPFVIFLCTDGVSGGIAEGEELELVRELEKNVDSSLLKEELEEFVISISDYSVDDRSVGVVKYERKNAESDR